MPTMSLNKIFKRSAALAVGIAACAAPTSAFAVVAPVLSPGTPPAVGDVLTAVRPVFAASTPHSTAWWRCNKNTATMWNPWVTPPTSVQNGCKMIAGTQYIIPVGPFDPAQLTYTVTAADTGFWIRFGEAALQNAAPYTGKYYQAFSNAVGTVGSVTYGSAVMSHDPLAYYRLADLANSSVLLDSTMNLHHGTYKPRGTTPRPGVSNDGDKAKIFNGLSSAYAYTNGITAPDEYTLQIWARPKTDAATTMMDHGGAGALGIEGGKWVFEAQDAKVVGPAVTPGAWTLVTGVFDLAEMTATLYVGHSAVGTEDVMTVPSGTATFYIGRGRFGDLFKGLLDEAVYYQTPLSHTDIHGQWDKRDITLAP